MNCKGIIWAGLAVKDLEKAITFYRDVLGLPLLRTGDGWASFDASNGARFDLFTGGTANSSPKKSESQPLSIGFKVDDLDAAVQELTSKGVALVGKIVEFKGERWIQLCDPDGNILELKQVPK